MCDHLSTVKATLKVGCPVDVVASNTVPVFCIMQLKVVMVK